MSHSQDHRRNNQKDIFSINSDQDNRCNRKAGPQNRDSKQVAVEIRHCFGASEIPGPEHVSSLESIQYLKVLLDILEDMRVLHFLFKQCFMGIRKLGERQTADTCIPSHQVDCMFDWDWVDIAEQRVD